jgi:hypothetical protein
MTADDRTILFVIGDDSGKTWEPFFGSVGIPLSTILNADQYKTYRFWAHISKNTAIYSGVLGTDQKATPRILLEVTLHPGYFFPAMAELL